MYGALRVKRFVHGTFTFLCRVSLLDLESRFSAPTRNCAGPARAGAVKNGRRADLAMHDVPARPLLDSSEHVGMLMLVGMTITRGARSEQRDSIAPHPCIRWVARTSTMMHSCASVRSSEAADPFYPSASKPCLRPGPRHLEPSSPTHHDRAGRVRDNR